MADDRDNLQIIQDALRQYGGPQKPHSSWLNVRCPFHDDVDPSCGIFVELGGSRSLGSYNCLGCGARGPWNEFAEKTGLPKIQEWKNNSVGYVTQIVTEDLESELLGDTGITFEEVKKRMGCEEAQRWPADLDWRGVAGQLVRDVGGHIINDVYNDSVAVLFPIKIAGKVRGGVKAIYEKQDGQKGKLGYVTMRGDWVRSYGLFPYVYTKNMLRRTGYKFVVLVEGPRDALRLLKNGIPALALLGANTSNKTKAMFILALGLTHVYAMPDNDQGGEATWATIRRIIDRTKVSLKRIKIPESPDGQKYDPGNMPFRYLRKLGLILEEAHGFDRSRIVETGSK